MREEDRGLLPRYVDGAGSLCSVACTGSWWRARARNGTPADRHRPSEFGFGCPGNMCGPWVVLRVLVTSNAGAISSPTHLHRPPVVRVAIAQVGWPSAIRRDSRGRERRCPGCRPNAGSAGSAVRAGSPPRWRGTQSHRVGKRERECCSGRESLLDEVMMHHHGARRARLCCRSQKFERCTA